MKRALSDRNRRRSDGTKDMFLTLDLSLEPVAAPYSLNAHRYRITRTLHLRTWIVNYGRSCPRMTYIAIGLQERASASSWRCLLGSFMLARGGKWRAGRRKKKKRVRQSPLPLHANIPAVLRLYRESREKKKKMVRNRPNESRTVLGKRG